ncbi:hypothetical protein D3C60_09595 [Bacillus velezensis]|uniref:hypothetical protein n=1 Tax=Bacillus velezensis TaxID=492670 RepID=UPI000E5B923E|nr:hypothetical protein [Bacillus velezensis]AXY37990.1 hypothetical protein D3C60_09595 [Bacillus velezensis]
MAKRRQEKIENYKITTEVTAEVQNWIDEILGSKEFYNFAAPLLNKYLAKRTQNNPGAFKNEKDTSKDNTNEVYLQIPSPQIGTNVCYCKSSPIKGGEDITKDTASIEIRYIEDLNDKEGKLLLKSTKKELSKDGEEFDLSMGDWFTLGLADGDLHVRVLRTEYDPLNLDKFVYYVSKYEED